MRGQQALKLAPVLAAAGHRGVQRRRALRRCTLHHAPLREKIFPCAAQPNAAGAKAAATAGAGDARTPDAGSPAAGATTPADSSR